MMHHQSTTPRKGPPRLHTVQDPPTRHRTVSPTRPILQLRMQPASQPTTPLMTFLCRSASNLPSQEESQDRNRYAPKPIRALQEMHNPSLPCHPKPGQAMMAFPQAAVRRSFPRQCRGTQ
ncbi:hypothetical protein DL95DRAFT_391373 [Leptodontidium sp. 2 PMI_412]|nr:hypothetical protein DL95DRAFT_391373 [Leptodontidium sp. 2 PMI_412]